MLFVASSKYKSGSVAAARGYRTAGPAARAGQHVYPCRGPACTSVAVARLTTCLKSSRSVRDKPSSGRQKRPECDSISAAGRVCAFSPKDTAGGTWSLDPVDRREAPRGRECRVHCRLLRVDSEAIS